VLEVGAARVAVVGVAVLEFAMETAFALAVVVVVSEV
jgi:hypothetical protein